MASLLACIVYLPPRGGGLLSNEEVGGLGPHSKFGGKIWGKVRPSSPNKRKKLGSSVTTRHKSWDNVTILRSYLKFRGQNLGCLSLIFLEAIFGAPTTISEANFGAKSPDLLILKHPPLGPTIISVSLLLCWETKRNDERPHNMWKGKDLWIMCNVYSMFSLCLLSIWNEKHSFFIEKTKHKNPQKNIDTYTKHR